MKLYVFLCIVYIVDSRPISDPNPGFECDIQCQQKYLIKYGYLDPELSNNEIASLEDHDKILQGIMNLQKDAGIKPTGLLDSLTTNLFQTPRCGMNSRQKRFVVVRGWDTPKNNLNETMVTWYLDLSNFDKIQSNMSKQVIRTIFSTSMAKWSNTSLLSLREVSNENEANITIKFLEGNHGDGYDFDGPGQVLAHAFYPTSGTGGDAHFDLGEKWTLWGEEEGISLFSVALHEIGHSLGLGHSSQENSVMYAWYRSKSTELQEDDKLAIDNVYGLRPEYRFAPLDPKHRIYKPQITTTQAPSTTTPSIKRFNKVPTTTKRYKMDIFKKLLIQNSRVYIYPKSTSSLSF